MEILYLFYHVYLFGIKAGYQEVRVEKIHSGYKIKTHLRTNPFFSKFYKVDNYLESIVDKDFKTLEFKKELLEGKRKESLLLQIDKENNIGSFTSILPYEGKINTGSFELPKEGVVDLNSIAFYLQDKLKKEQQSVYITNGDSYHLCEIEIKKAPRKIKALGKLLSAYIAQSKEIKIWFWASDNPLPLHIEVIKPFGKIIGILKRFTTTTGGS